LEGSVIIEQLKQERSLVKVKRADLPQKEAGIKSITNRLTVQKYHRCHITTADSFSY